MIGDKKSSAWCLHIIQSLSCKLAADSPARSGQADGAARTIQLVRLGP